jgi:hypothetical protein
MMRGVAKLGSATLTVAEFAIVLSVLLVLGATTIPTLVRARKR